MKRTLIATTLFLLAAGLCLGQEVRGTIAGQVLDPSGAAVPKAAVTAINTETNIPTATTTSDSGAYSISFLQPGVYKVTAAVRGFKTTVREGIEVQVSDHLTVDIRLELGNTTEAVTVSASAAPVLEDASASMGEVISNSRVSELPLIDGNPLLLTYASSAGVVYYGTGMTLIRPFDNDNSSKLIANGAPTYANEWTLDGAPNSATSSKVGFIPPALAVEEFKVDTLTYDAQKARAGVSVNMVMKTGTNQFHGQLQEAYRPDSMVAMDFFTKRAGNPRGSFMYHRYGGTLGGPVVVPRVYNGHNKTFFFFAYEGIRSQKPQPVFKTTPAAAEKTGDFSALLSQKLTIYDPYSAVASSTGTITRTPFAGNIISANRLNPVAQAVMNYYPAPNTAGDAQGANNFLSQDAQREPFNSQVFTLSHLLNYKHRFVLRINRNYRNQDYDGWTGDVNGVRGAALLQHRETGGINYEHTYMISPLTVLTGRAGVSHYSDVRLPVGNGFDPAQLGFPASTVAKFNGAQYFPSFTLASFSDLTSENGAASTAVNDTWYGSAVISRFAGRHSLKGGYDMKLYRQSAYPYGTPAGDYQFDGTYTRSASNGSSLFGQDLASLLIGLPNTKSQYVLSANSAVQSVLHSLFFQDDIRAASRLTLNVGLRWDYEVPTSERFNRSVRGFDSTVANPISAAARAAYAANPDSSVAPSAFAVNGGLLFADARHHGLWNANAGSVQPVFGLAYHLTPKTVLRGGWRLNWVPRILSGLQQDGFSSTTSIAVTPDNGLTFPYNLSNPVAAVLNPVGNAAGLATSLGQSLSVTPLDRRNIIFQQFSAEVQRELWSKWVVRVGYTGSLGNGVTVTRQLDPLSAQYRSMSAWNDADMIARNTYVTAKVANPFQNLIPGSTINGSTLSRSQLLLPYPEFTGVATENYLGRAKYSSLQLRADKHLNRDLDMTVSYTYSRNWQWTNYLNATDTELEKKISNNDRPQRITLNAVWTVPYGTGLRWHSGGWFAGRLANRVLGNWQLSTVFLGQSGAPIGLGNNYFSGGLSSLHAVFGTNNVGPIVFDTSAFYFHDAAVQTNGVDDPVKQRADPRIKLANNIRLMPSSYFGFRGDRIINVDSALAKTFAIHERYRIQIRGELVNSLNRMQFSDPSTDPASASFGHITSTTQQSIPRQVQFTGRFTF